MARAMTTPEQTLMRTAGQRSKLRLAIYNPATVYAARVNQTITTTDQVKELIYDGGSGTLANVLPDMTLLVGTAAGLGDKGVLRIRKAPSATVIYFNETSEVAWADNDYLTVLNEFLPAARPVFTAGESLLIDSEIAYTGQHFFCEPVPIMGPAVAVLELTGASVSHTRSPGASYCPGSTISTYAWAATGPASVTITNGTTVTPTFVFTAIGWYRLALTVTAANYVSRTGYRWVYIWDAAHPLIDFSGPAPTGSQDAGGWEFSITKANQADLTYIDDRAMVAVVAEDWYGSTKQSVGPVSGFENVVAIGWISGETIEWDPRKFSVKFSVKGPHYWLSQLNAQSVTLKNITDAIPTEWDQFHDLTVDQALWHVCAWRSTITTCMDVFLTGDTALVPIISGTGSSLWEALRTISKKIGASPLCDRYGRLFIEVDTQVLPTADRAAIPIVMDVGKVDWKDSIQLARRLTRVVSILDLSAQSYDGTTTTQILARAPGNVGAQYGRPDTSDGWIVPTQDRANELAGLIWAQRNNAYPVEPISIAANNRMIDICPRQVITQSLSTGDTVRGLSWTTRRLIPRRVEFVLNPKTGRMHTEVEAETETTGPVGVKVIPSQPPVVNIPPQPPIPKNPPPGWVDTPWYPPYVPKEPKPGSCGSDLGSHNGPWTLYFDNNILLPSNSVYAYFPAAIRAKLAGYNTTYMELYAVAQFISADLISVAAIDNAKAVLLNGFFNNDPVNSYVVEGRGVKFEPTNCMEIAGIKISLGSGTDWDWNDDQPHGWQDSGTPYGTFGMMPLGGESCPPVTTYTGGVTMNQTTCGGSTDHDVFLALPQGTGSATGAYVIFNVTWVDWDHDHPGNWRYLIAGITYTDHTYDTVTIYTGYENQPVNYYAYVSAGNENKEVGRIDIVLLGWYAGCIVRINSVNLVGFSVSAGQRVLISPSYLYNLVQS
jgi:hypothetical protein